MNDSGHGLLGSRRPVQERLWVLVAAFQSERGEETRDRAERGSAVRGSDQASVAAKRNPPPRPEPRSLGPNKLAAESSELEGLVSHRLARAREDRRPAFAADDAARAWTQARFGRTARGAILRAVGCEDRLRRRQKDKCAGGRRRSDVRGCSCRSRCATSA